MSQTTPPGPGVTAAPPPPPPPRTRPPLRRSCTDRKWGGVAGGLARYFDVDPLLVRIGFVVLAITAAGAGLLLYVACLLMIPMEGDDVPPARHFVDRHGRLLAAIAGVFVVIALFSAAGPFGWGPRHGPWGLVVALAIVGIVWVIRNDRRENAALRGAGGAAYVGTTPYSANVATPATPSPYAATAQVPPMPPPVPSATTYAPVPPRRPRERSALGPITVGAALLTAGALVAIDRGGSVSVPTVVVLASALAVVGLGLVVGGFFGRSRGLIALAVVLAVATAVAGVVHVPGNGKAGDQTWTPATARDVAPLYQWGAGDTVLDLRTVTSPTTVSTRVELGAGQITVKVPASSVVHVHAQVGAGTIVLDNQLGTTDTVNGIGRETTTTLRPQTTTRTTTEFELDLQVGLGQVEVQRATS